MLRDKMLQARHSGGFRCGHCRTWVAIHATMGTANRNHCNLCLWSKHVDERKGDRRATCRAAMEPLGLTFKHEGQGRVGEVMLVHRCTSCHKLSINRLAADDAEAEVLAVYEASLRLGSSLSESIASGGIRLLGKADEGELRTQLFGR